LLIRYGLSLRVAIALVSISWHSPLSAQKRSEAECKARWDVLVDTHKQATERLPDVALRPMKLSALRQVLGDDGEGRPGDATNEWVIRWYRGPGPDEKTALEWCGIGHPDSDWAKFSPTVEAHFLGSSETQPGPDAMPIELEVRHPFPGKLMGLRIGDPNVALEKKKGYSISGRVAELAIDGWTVRWGTEQGQIGPWVQALNPSWRTVYRPR
jgi:hypothetical protein